MPELASSFDDAWARFQALDGLRLRGDTLEWEWSRGRAQWLTFLARVEDAGPRDYLRGLTERLAGIPGVETYPDWYWHVTIKGIGFQVIKRTRDDEVLRERVSSIVRAARDVIASRPAFEIQLRQPSGFPEVVFVEVHDRGAVRALNEALCNGLDVPRYPIDGAAFLPHISVARFESNEGLAELKATLGELRGGGPGPAFPVRRVELIRAWLTDEMPEFETLSAYQLAAP